MDWIVSEKTGLATRDLVLGNKASFTNNDWIMQYGDYGMQFDNSGEYVRTSSIPTFQQLTRYVTIEIVFTRDTGGSGTPYGTVACLAQGGSFGDRQWLLENDNGNIGWGMTFQIWWESQPGIWGMDYPAADQIHHWVVIYDGGSDANDPIFVLNGNPNPPGFGERLNPVGSLRTGGSTFTMGNNNDAGGTWDGNVYGCRVWNRLLTVTEARELYRDRYQIYKQPRFNALNTSSPVVYNSMKMMLGMGI